MRRERRRYIVMRADPKLVEAVVQATECEVIKRLSPDGILIRCGHLNLPAVKEKLTSMGCEILGVSGTIKRALKKFWNRPDRNS